MIYCIYTSYICTTTIIFSKAIRRKSNELIPKIVIIETRYILEKNIIFGIYLKFRGCNQPGALANSFPLDAAPIKRKNVTFSLSATTGQSIPDCNFLEGSFHHDFQTYLIPPCDFEEFGILLAPHVVGKYIIPESKSLPQYGRQVTSE